MSDPKDTWMVLAKALAVEEGDAHAAVILLGIVLNVLGDMAERLARVEGRTRR